MARIGTKITLRWHQEKLSYNIKKYIFSGFDTEIISEQAEIPGMAPRNSRDIVDFCLLLKALGIFISFFFLFIF